MAEAVGLVASIVTLVELAFKISRGLTAVASEFGTAARQIKLIGTDTRALAIILRDLSRGLGERKQIAVEIQEVTAELIALCKEDLDDIGDFLKSLQPLQSDKIGLRQKVRWVFGKSRVMMRRTSLNSLKSTLNLFLHTIDMVGYGEVE